MPAASIEYGTRALTLELRIKRRRGDLDSARGRFQSAAETTFAVGSSIPGYSGLIIDEVDTEQDGPVWLHEVTAMGNAGGKPERVLADEITVTEGDWDTGSYELLTTNARALRLGMSHPRAANLICVAAPSVALPEAPLWYRVAGSYRGLVEAKPYKLQIDSAGREISPPGQFVNNLSGGWSTPQKGEILWPRSVLHYTTVETSIPTFPILSGNGAPPQAPAVPSLTFTGALDSIVYHWPSGWTLQGVAADVIAGTTISLVKRSYMFNERVTFG